MVQCFNFTILQKRAFRRIRISAFNFPSQYVALHIQFNQREIQTLTFANVTIHLSHTQYLSLSKHCHMRNVTIKLSNLSIVLFLTKSGGQDNLAPDNLAPGQFGTGQFDTKIVKMDNFAPQFFGMISSKNVTVVFFVKHFQKVQ